MNKEKNIANGTQEAVSKDAPSAAGQSAQDEQDIYTVSERKTTTGGNPDNISDPDISSGVC